MNETVTVELTKQELQVLSAALGNHTRSELHGHLTEDFGADVAEEIIPTQDSIFSVLIGGNLIHKLFGKIREALEEAQ